MKTIYIVRHGKSSWEDMNLQDYERPLIEKGIKRTRKVARFLAEKKIVPGVIISSHAVRAHETAKIIAGKIGYQKGRIEINENLYFSGQDAIESILFGLDEKIESAMIVGHNPDMTNFANLFLSHQIDYLPTTGVVCVEFDTNEWTNIFMAPRKIPFIVIPKKL